MPVPSTAAEEAQPEAIEAITVTGIRLGVEAAIAVKRKSDEVIEVVSAEIDRAMSVGSHAPGR